MTFWKILELFTIKFKTTSTLQKVIPVTGRLKYFKHEKIFHLQG